jgi:antitoxin (DNA-binding transcriptional repressor) of toxin-antitoxin stability system
MLDWPIVKSVDVSELQSRLEACLELAWRGETVEITEHGQPIARITATDPLRRSGSGEFERLVESGLISRSSAGLDEEFLKLAPIKCTGDIVRTLLDDRETR